ncbi:FecR family protein [Flavihumibacter solisilvae]|uniref:FecR protein domain-containing protein n=1 Tax=Flavihumibacter solisilvae TaxID=1349421 RepID=A0A0C1IKY0_9BACT|nr:FecR domain-containing protein [Flavihumibacter solisilvae]KIC94830.1 hypothetical protein OI18_10245 [Flavihumibacter solisilvae]
MPLDRLWELLAKKLSGEASLPELDELTELLRQQPEMHYPLQTITDLWHYHPPHNDDPTAAYDRHLNRMAAMSVDFNSPAEDAGIEFTAAEEETTPQPSRNRKLLWATISCLLLAVAAVWFLNTGRDRQSSSGPGNQGTYTVPTSEVSTGNGSKSKTVLPDGTQVWLNAGSKLVYNKDFGQEKREATLTGEAYFDVVKDPSQPFIIHTSQIDIRVLGTAFNVRSYPGDKTTEASLIRGSIEVRIHERPEEKILLKPNEKLVVNNDPGATQVKDIVHKAARKAEPLVVIDRINYWPSDSTILETSWMDNKLIFRDESFAELALRMERWFGVEISFNDEGLQKERLTGIFKTETLQQALDALQIVSPFRYRIEGNKVYLFK